MLLQEAEMRSALKKFRDLCSIAAPHDSTCINNIVSTLSIKAQV